MRYKKDYKTSTNKKRYKEVKDIKKNDRALFEKMRTIEKKYKKAGSSVIDNLDAETLEMYKKYHSYSNYKKYYL